MKRSDSCIIWERGLPFRRVETVRNGVGEYVTQPAVVSMDGAALFLPPSLFRTISTIFSEAFLTCVMADLTVSS